MTVKQLIDALVGLPDDMPVKFWTAVPHTLLTDVRSVHDERAASGEYECCLSDETE